MGPGEHYIKWNKPSIEKAHMDSKTVDPVIGQNRTVVTRGLDG
jgi:hypothetical protein